MSKPILDDDPLTKLADLEQRVATLERVPRVPQITTTAVGIRTAVVTTFETTTSTSYADLATPGPEVTVTIGPSGRVFLQGGAFAYVSDTNLTADIGLSVDGAAAIPVAALENNFGGSGGTSPAFGRLIENLTPGEHTFRLRYLSSSGVQVGFEARWLVALPL